MLLSFVYGAIYLFFVLSLRRNRDLIVTITAYSAVTELLSLFVVFHNVNFIRTYYNLLLDSTQVIVNPSLINIFFS